MRRLKVLLIILAILVLAGNVFLFLNDLAADTQPPVLKVDSDTLELSVTAEETDYLQGVTATDNKDGNISANVFVEHSSQLTGDDTVQITYGVFDAAGNAATAARTIHYTDYTSPRFSLSQPLRYSVGEVVTLKDRLTAMDALDGNISGNIRMTNINLSNDVEGIYRIRVQITNSLGDTQVLTLPVVIENDSTQTPELTLTDYIVYLKAGDSFSPEDYIAEVSDPVSIKKAKNSDVQIQTNADLNTPGVYDVTYTYTGEKDNITVVLALVVTE